MDPKSALSGAKEKDDFLNKAHEARRARELARKREDAATLIQSHFRKYLTLSKLKNEALCQSSYLDKITKLDNDFQALHRSLFFCDSTKDRNVLDKILKQIHHILLIGDEFRPRSDNKPDVLQEDNEINPPSDKPESSSECDKLISAQEKFVHWLEGKVGEHFPKRIITTCLTLTEKCLQESDLIAAANYLQLTEFILSSPTDAIKTPKTYRNLKTFSTETRPKRKSIFLHLPDSISKLSKIFSKDAKRTILEVYVTLGLNLINVEPKDDKAQLCITMLTVPALVHHLKEYSDQSISRLTSAQTNASGYQTGSPLSCFLKILATSQQQLHALTSTPALCIAANIINLVALDENILTCELLSVVLVITNLLDLCRKNMKTSGPQCKTTDESYNHILGWLTREQSFTIDQETSKLIKQQLSHLWNMRMLKLLFNDLISQNRNRKNDPKLTASIVAETTVSRRIVTILMSKSKSASPTNAHSRLLTEEAKSISLVCSMFHTALKTLKMLKQEILTGLCLQDYVLCNLWSFISSLSSQNGLKAFLDFLAINTKTNMPEFHLLLLFCECASHIISILDDSELYETQRPFTIEDLINISTFLNLFVFRILSNQLITYKPRDVDPVLQSTHKLLTDLYKRDCRRKFTTQDHWLIRDLKMSLFFKDLEGGKPVAQAILILLPHIIPHKERVLIFRKLVFKDRAQYSTGYHTFITIHRSRIVEDGYQQLARLPPNALKGLIRVKFINDHGLDEAGIDQDGVFKEFLEDTIKRVFDPALNLFSTTSEQRLYPSPTSRLHEDHLSLFNFVGKVLGKALYEGIVVDVPFATFFLSRVLGQHHSALYSPIDELPSLDPELYKSLTYIKHYEGDVSELDLTFSIDQDIMGKIETFELEPGGKFMPVTKDSRVRYIHSVANFRMKTQIEEQTEAFVRGFKSIINLEWLHMFSASELQRLISGDTAPIDLIDLRKHTKYFGGFHNNHRVISWLWDILERDFSPEDHRLFLKFVTSCSKPPLLGFAHLEPPFSIRCVEVSDDQDSGDTVGSVLRGFFAIRRSDPVDRLPTSSTCFNLLKLPNYQRRSTLREKLRYAIRSNPGFELS